MPELQVIARHTMLPGKEAEVFAVLPKLIEASRKEAGNIDFQAYCSVDQPRSYVLLERYASRDAFTAHRESPHFTEFMLKQILPNLDMRTIEQFDVPE
jgi:quinol monooxygenase YgiN